MPGISTVKWLLIGLTTGLALGYLAGAGALI